MIPLSACGDASSTAAEVAPASNTARVLFMECTDLEFVVEIKQHDAWLFLPDYSGPLPQVPSASGSKYEGDNIVFWMKGDQASLDYGANRYTNCRNNPARAVWEGAKLRGVDFRAVGNEPGWILEITGDSLYLQTDYGNTSYRFSGASQTDDEAAQQTVFQASRGDSRIEVTLANKSCQDSMADISYQTTVTVQLDQRTLHGCGKALH
jgi:putative lipoprotein